ncbi:MAG: DNA polymerase III subunit delta [Candidatus Dojkabacteria bacterium]
MKYKLYHGTSSYLSLEVVHEEINKLKDEDPSLSLILLEADSSTPQKIIDTISSPSLFSKRRIVFLKRIYKNKEKKIITENILELLENRNGEDILFFWEDEKLRSNTKYYKFFKEKGKVEEVNELNKRTFFSWLRKELERNDLKIDPSVIKELAERTNYDPERCSNELKKFKLNNEKRIIRKEDIEELTPDTIEKDIWGLIDAINSGDRIKSISILENLHTQTIDANYILSMLARNTRTVFLTKHLLKADKSSREISSILRIPPFTTPSIIKMANNSPIEKLETLYTKLSNLDYQIKTGKIDANLGISLITGSFASLSA